VRRSVVAALLGCALAAPAARASEGRPDLTHLIGRARLVVNGDVTDVATYDSARFTVATLTIRKALKGTADSERVQVVERHDLPSSPQFLVNGHHVVAFLGPARRNSALKHALPPGTYYEIVGGAGGVIASADAAGIEESVAIVTRLIDAQRKPEKDPARRAAATRALVFDEIASRHAAIVGDGAGNLSRVDDLAATLTDPERARLEAALRRPELPPWVRVKLIDAVAECNLTALIPTLRDLPQPTPDVQRAAWNALRRLGAAPATEDLDTALSNDDAAIRAVGVEALIVAQGPEARPRLEQLALRDPDQKVRLAAIEALGKTGPQALPTLESVFAGKDWTERRAAGRAISAVGGRAAAESYARLAFEGPPNAQKLAVTLLLMTGISHDDPLVQRIAEKHPDEGVRHIVESGLDFHEH